MKIGILLYPTFGGSGVMATELGKVLAQRGFEVHFISYNIPARLTHFHGNVFFHEVSVKSYPLFDYVPYETILASKIVDIVLRQNLDILHAHYAIPHASAAIMAKMILKEKGIDIPLVTTLHGTDITLVGRNPTYKPVVEYSINNSEAVTAVSESLKSDTKSIFNIKNEIDVIYNFVHVDESEKLKDDDFRISIAPNGERILVHSSNFRKVKRIEDVLKVFNEVNKQLPSKLVIIGDGPERDAIEDLCQKLQLCNSIIFLGRQEAVYEILANCDLFLLTSETESFGLAALEAMACGTPVVSTNAGGIPEVNKDGYSGFLLPVGDVKGMADKALYILSSDERLKQFSNNALKHAKEFSIDKAIDGYCKIYNRAIASKNK
ncbi:MAG: N-acetyl-alpha-D-glucosaminyl L-malate synthase BshA [Bacteroidetes bacterium]|nr:N-acetyl-alpha-D-glucosaminyl L-malate synthase BshA [Bacteroidota bacterium]